MTIVIDASVLADIWIKSRPRHAIANRLADQIKRIGLEVIIPMHAILELKCAIDNERQTPGKGELSRDTFHENDPLKVTQIPIDNSFLQNYLDLSIPYIKAGDLPYILIAKKKNCPLLTEDKKQYKVASAAGVRVYKISEFLKSVENR